MNEFRCHRCGALLFKYDADALRADKRIEIKCKCNAISRFVGEPETT